MDTLEILNDKLNEITTKLDLQLDVVKDELNSVIIDTTKASMQSYKLKNLLNDYINLINQVGIAYKVKREEELKYEMLKNNIEEDTSMQKDRNSTKESKVKIYKKKG